MPWAGDPDAEKRQASAGGPVPELGSFVVQPVTDYPTLRDRFAMAVLPGLVGVGGYGYADATAEAYRYADAMLEARKRGGQ